MIIFRCDASRQIGMGHLSRCRTLAEEFVLQGEVCTMVGPPEEFKTKNDVSTFQSWITKSWGPSSAEEAEFVCSFATQTETDLFILDDYRVDETYQLTLRKQGFSWLQFDYQAKQPLWADWVINTNPIVEESFYRDVLKNPHTQLLLGPKYAIIRPEFRYAAAKRYPRDPNLVLICMGGGDDRGSIRFILESLLPHAGACIHFIIISGSYNPRNTANQDWIKSHYNDQVDYLINPPNIPELFCKAGLGVLAGGTTTYESACCGLPMLLLNIAENQVRLSLAWSSIGHAQYCGFYPVTTPLYFKECFFRKMNEITNTPTNIYSRSYDGLGAYRIYTELTKKSNK